MGRLVLLWWVSAALAAYLHRYASIAVIVKRMVRGRSLNWDRPLSTGPSTGWEGLRGGPAIPHNAWRSDLVPRLAV